MKNHGITAAVLAATATFGVQSASAAPTIFFGENLNPGETVSGDPVTARDDFLDNLSGVGTENFEGFSSGATAPVNLTFPGAGDAQLTGDGEIESGPSVGRFATSGSQYWEVSGDFEIDFTDPVAAFGFFGTDIGDFDGQVTVDAGLEGGGSTQFTINNTIDAPNGSLLYWGLIDTANPFTSLVFGNTNAGTDFFGFDDMTIGSVQQVVPDPVQTVPLPTTVALFGLGLAGLGFARRRRSRA